MQALVMDTRHIRIIPETPSDRAILKTWKKEFNHRSGVAVCAKLSNIYEISLSLIDINE